MVMEAERSQDLHSARSDSGELTVYVSVGIQVLRQEKTNVPAQRQSDREQILPHSCYSIQAFNALDEGQPR